MKKYFSLFLITLFFTSCTPLSEQDKILQDKVNKLYEQSQRLEDTVEVNKQICDSLQQEIHIYESKKTIYGNGKIPVYILTLHFQEHKMEISFDRISFSFDVPVDEQFYKECTIGEELGHGSRSFKLFHSGDITVENKRIEYR